MREYNIDAHVGIWFLYLIALCAPSWKKHMTCRPAYAQLQLADEFGSLGDARIGGSKSVEKRDCV